MVAEAPRFFQSGRIPFRANPGFGSLITIELIFGEFAGFKATPCFCRKGFEVFGPTAPARCEAIRMQAGIQERERAPAANEFIFGQRG